MVRTRRRQSPPQELVDNRDAWTENWRDIHAGRKTGEWANRRAKAFLRRALEALTHGKCVYCESTPSTTGYLAIEHYVAKSVAPCLAFEWTNLLPACTRCNRTKGECDHQGVLLKPDAEDPEEYFWVDPDSGALQLRHGLDEGRARRAEETIRLCDLQRQRLRDERLDLWMRVGRWVNRIIENGGNLNRELTEELEEFLVPRCEYKLVIRQVLRQRSRADLAAEDRRRFEAPPQTTSSLTGSQRTVRWRR